MPIPSSRGSPDSSAWRTLRPSPPATSTASAIEWISSGVPVPAATTTKRGRRCTCSPRARRAFHPSESTSSWSSCRQNALGNRHGVWDVAQGAAQRPFTPTPGSKGTIRLPQHGQHVGKICSRQPLFSFASLRHRLFASLRHALFPKGRFKRWLDRACRVLTAAAGSRSPR